MSYALRLLVGFAGKGPFNRPVYLQNEAQRQKLFGDIDSKLEKKGRSINIWNIWRLVSWQLLRLLPAKLRLSIPSVSIRSVNAEITDEYSLLLKNMISDRMNINKFITSGMGVTCFDLILLSYTFSVVYKKS